MMQNTSRAILIVMLMSLVTISAAIGGDIAPIRGLTEINHSQVELTGGFWAARQKTHIETTIPHALDALERDGHVTNFDKAAGIFDGPLRGHHAFDSDLHKALEGALYSLQHQDDPALLKRVEGILDRIIAAQQKDGFLISYFIVQNQEKRWDTMRLEHQMYNAGHLFEMAVEHNRLGGSTKVLDAAKRFADHIDSVFGPGKRYDVGGHEEIELALVKLYRATGEQRYLDLCRFLLDERGMTHDAEHKLFDPSSIPKELPNFDHLPENKRRQAQFHARLSVRNGRMQDHKPLVAQTKAIGHAVRAGYIYSAMADIARFSDAPAYEKAAKAIWQDVVEHKMYVNGAIGTAQYGDEGFGDPYLLPNKTYCESCASIAQVFWQHRMNLLTGEAKYADVMELALFNAAISGISIEGNSFFYQNPLESKNGGRRSSWIGLSCCPTNLARIIPQVGGYLYAQSKQHIFVNLFAAGEATITMSDGAKVKMTQETNYPWDGEVKLTIAPEKVDGFDLCVRIPGWTQGHPVPSNLYRFADTKVAPVTLKVNGKAVKAKPGKDGYVHITRSWKAGDVVTLDMPMPVHRIYANGKLKEDNGKVALMRGPIIYCLEAVDNPGTDLFKAALLPSAKLRGKFHTDLLGGVGVVRATGIDQHGDTVNLTAVPYYAWANRDKGQMTVWVNETPTKPVAKKPARKQAGKSPVKVFILAGQSNMQGQGVVDMNDPKDYNGGKGNLVHVMANSPLASMYTHLKDANGKWAVRNDVWVRYKTKRELLKGPLTIGFTGYGGKSHIGPELQIGHILGAELDNQVLLVKTAWGGKSLFADFRPPSSGDKTGPYYTKMLEEVQEALGNLRKDFPEYDGGGYEIAGFIWFQGWNDMFDGKALAEYEENMANLIRDVRKEWNLPNLPIVIGELGNGGPNGSDNMLTIRKAQATAAARPEFKGNVVFIPTTDFARASDQSPNKGHGHHWFGNAESYFLVGDALGKGIMGLLERDKK